MALTPEQIADILGNRKTKGLYEEKLQVYLDSDDAAIDVAEQWPLDFGKKSASSMYQSFGNAAKKLGVADVLDIVNRDGHLFILHKDRVELALADAE